MKNNELLSLNVNKHIEEKNRLKYLSWSWAWGEMLKHDPNCVYEIKHFDGKPYIYDENLGYMVFTSVTSNGITREMWLPVMDGANKAMKSKPYTYKVKNYKTGGMIDKTVNSATMFDINKTIMRCLTKNLAMFGLGLYIYAGEDLPEENTEVIETKEKEMKSLKTREELVKYWKTLNPTQQKALTTLKDKLKLELS